MRRFLLRKQHLEINVLFLFISIAIIQNPRDEIHDEIISIYKGVVLHAEKHCVKNPQ